MSDPSQLWADPRLVYTVAATAVAMLLVTIWLFRRKSHGGRQAGVICLMLSIGLHVALIFLVPLLQPLPGGSSATDPDTSEQAGINAAVSFSTFDPEMSVDDASGVDQQSLIAPLPVSNLTEISAAEPSVENITTGEKPEPETSQPAATELVPESLVDAVASNDSSDLISEIDSQLADLLEAALADDEPEPINNQHMPIANEPEQPPPSSPARSRVVHVTDEETSAVPASTSAAPMSTVPGVVESDFANRIGNAKVEALLRTGGDANTEAAVQAALRFLASAQRDDGAWDPRASGAGVERAPLGMKRGGAGTHAETALTGLALLALTGAGHTHQQGDYSDHAYRGLVYLIRNQKPDGSLAGSASVYEANYSHGMAALAMCETAAITHDPSALQSAGRAISHTRRMQHPTTGGWRYTAGDPGDLSQLGWQAMVLDAGHRAGVTIDPRAVSGVERFLRSVRAGSVGGLASYRPGESPSRTMTAESLATRLLIGETVPADQIAEAERYLLQQPPGVGQDNYYYWYYATIALHQLQDEAWDRWNVALKQRLLATQRSDGSWPTDTVWGGYGGTVYTTAMATLCLEAYYRHAIRSNPRMP